MNSWEVYLADLNMIAYNLKRKLKLKQAFWKMASFYYVLRP